ncbi:hemerythrin domain-containing protein [Enterovibrio makurazakiensis]|uniref:Hemerythrin domain-containing protein n=1 Tax=Enterovibrio gelatinilyticus TaxID=2899819 RepID=A0ABT5R324_9GAMM|nr:hemerythrin domain-containing protein [Enterovibrio sp. ZSDZ42]MDD1794156.1 hemerythrin domain-containing protein [Enterovibrio sp. ZSDZ42]
MLVDSIHRDHRNISRLLRLLTDKLAAIRSEQPVDYGYIRDTLLYLKDHAERCHHPKEDLIYHYYLTNYADTEGVAALDEEHETLAALTAEFAISVDMILMDSVIPLDVFAGKLTEFVEQQQRHLELEERSVLPAIEKALTAEDWNYLQSQWEEEDDPLFGEQVAARFKALAAAM